MKTVAEYKQDLFVIAAEFQTDDAGKLERINSLINMALQDYSHLQGLRNFDRIIVYAVASQLRESALNAANTSGYSSVKAGTESITMHSATGLEGNSYKAKLEELLPNGSQQTGRRSFGAHMGGVRS